MTNSDDILKLARGVNFAEVGRSGLRAFSGILDEEFLAELKGHLAYKVYNEMRMNDPVIAAMLFAVEQLIRGASLNIVVQDKSPEGLKARDLIATSFDDMDRSWSDTLSEILTFLPFGWSLCEVTYKKRDGRNSRYNDGQYGWKAIALRSQDTLNRWNLDDANNVISMEQIAPPDYQIRTIPYERCLHFRTRAEKNSPEGTSILRHVFRSWIFKKRMEEIEGIGVERELTGLPLLIPPENLDLWNSNDANAKVLLDRAEQLVRSIRMDQHQGVVLPHGWELKLLASSGQRTFNTTDMISRWDARIAVTMLADMILIGHERVGSFALVASKTKLFASGLEGYAKAIAEVFNRRGIPKLLRINGFNLEKPPYVQFGPVEPPSLKDLGDYVSRLSGAGLQLDEPLTRYLRQIANFPPPPATSEETSETSETEFDPDAGDLLPGEGEGEDFREVSP